MAKALICLYSLSLSLSVCRHRFEGKNFVWNVAPVSARWLLLLPFHLRPSVSFSVSISSLSATFIWVLFSVKVTLLIQTLIMKGRELGLRYGHLRVVQCVGVCVRMCEAERMYLIGGRWWQGAELCLPPLYSPSEHRDCPRLAWNSETHKGHHQYTDVIQLEWRSDRLSGDDFYFLLTITG